MPELPDVDAYVEALRERVAGEPLLAVKLASPFLLRTADPPLREVEGRRVVAVSRLGKRIVLALEGDLFLAAHLMIAGRLRWIDAGGKKPARTGSPLATLEFPRGTLLLTEAGTKRRAALHLVRGEAQLAALDRGGLEPLETDEASFLAALRRENHTLKRALTDPRLFSGIGNAYSDEILHRARLSPVKLTSRLDEAEARRLFEATRAVLGEWRDRLRAERGGGFPEHVTAFRPGFAVHGRHRQPCPDCGAPVQRIVHADNETDYCPRCQTGGQILSDRSLARLLKDDWPRTIEELENKPGFGVKAASGGPAGSASRSEARRAPPSRGGAPAARPPGRGGTPRDIDELENKPGFGVKAASGGPAGSASRSEARRAPPSRGGAPAARPAGRGGTPRDIDELENEPGFGVRSEPPARRR